MVQKTDTITSTESFNLVKNFQLINRDLLLADDVLTTYQIVKTKGSGRILSRQKVDETSTKLSFKLKNISLSDLDDIRRTKIPSFVLKDGDTLYYAQIPDNISFVSSNLLGKHKCGEPCIRLSPTSDQNGGCAKVRNRSSRIERYPWIRLGFETFNTKHNAFIVAECEHYSLQLPKLQPKKRNSCL